MVSPTGLGWAINARFVSPMKIRVGARPAPRPINNSMRMGTLRVARRLTDMDKRSTHERMIAGSDQDAALVESVKAGQAEAFGTLVLKYQDRVFNTCWRLCGHLEDARDLTQEAFLKAFEGIHSFRQQSGFYTWLFRVAVNVTLSHRRRMTRHRIASLDSNFVERGRQAETLVRRMGGAMGDDPERESNDAELQGLVVQALQRLDGENRAVVVLRDLEGFDYREIGLILEIPPGTVKSRLHRARMALREAVSPSLRPDQPEHKH